jgi:hypothetical protein
MDFRKCISCIRFSKYKGEPRDAKGNVLGWCQQLSLQVDTNNSCRLWVVRPSFLTTLSDEDCKKLLKE